MHQLSVARLSRLVRSNVKRQCSSNGRSRESGAVASIVAILFGTGVLLGLGALVLDTGSLLYERRQLQNGADAASLSLARNCAKAQAGVAGYVCDTSTSTKTDLADLAGLNAADSKSDIFNICGSQKLSDANSAFTVCPAPSPALVECPATSSTANYVEVRTATKTASNSPILPPILSQMLAGGNYSGETVKACARAGWGPLGSSGPALPLVIGVCEWNKATANGTLYAPPPTPPATQYTPAPNQTDYRKGGGTPYTPALSLTPAVVPANTIVSIIAHTSSGSSAVNNCPENPAPPAGQDYPGGFGWTTSDTTCSAIFADTGSLTGDGGGAPPQDCKHVGPVSSYVGKIVNIPIFTNDAISNGTATYTISGLAAFYLAGYANISTVSDMFGYAAPASLQCVPGAPSTCIWGWFTQPDPSGGEIGGGELRGPIVVQGLG